ncbi:hypothetical protein ACJW30_11G155800 [Castanea mollissima]
MFYYDCKSLNLSLEGGGMWFVPLVVSGGCHLAKIFSIRVIRGAQDVSIYTNPWSPSKVILDSSRASSFLSAFHPIWMLKLSSPKCHLLRGQVDKLLGKVALVTGGATGIGESVVRLFHKHGAKVCIVDVQDKLGRDVSDTLGGEPNTCYFHCDVSKEDDVCRAVDFTVNKFGTLDIVVNNAGLSGSPCSDIRNADISEFEKIFDVNVKGVFLGMKHAARIMIPLKKGSIISLCSVASVIRGLGPHPYTGSKHAVLGLTKNVAAELGLHGIRVNCVSPYAVATGLALAHLPENERTEDAMAGFRDFVGKNANLPGVELTVDDVANSVLFLASDEARYVSGANLMVDGGFTCTNHLLRVFR